MIFRLERFVLSFLLLLSFVTTSVSHAVIHGTPVKSDELPFLFSIEGSARIDGNDASIYCSATLIHPRLLLTAAHCFSNGGEFTEARNGTDFSRTRTQGLTRSIERGRAHPMWSSNIPKSNIRAMLNNTGYDVGYVLLDHEILENEVKPAAIELDSPETFMKYFQMPVQLSGYGYGDVEKSFLGPKRTSFKNLSQVGPNFFAVDGLEGGLAPGDSGGGLFA